jgi:hypothetical protein
VCAQVKIKRAKPDQSTFLGSAGGPTMERTGQGMSEAVIARMAIDDQNSQRTPVAPRSAGTNVGTCSGRERAH